MEYRLSFCRSTGKAEAPMIRARALFDDGTDIPFPLCDQFDVLDGKGSYFISEKKIEIIDKKLLPDRKSVSFSFSVTDQMTHTDLQNGQFGIKVVLYSAISPVVAGMTAPGMGAIVRGAPLSSAECSIIIVPPDRRAVLEIRKCSWTTGKFDLYSMLSEEQIFRMSRYGGTLSVLLRGRFVNQDFEYVNEISHAEATLTLGNREISGKVVDKPWIEFQIPPEAGIASGSEEICRISEPIDLRLDIEIEEVMNGLIKVAHLIDDRVEEHVRQYIEACLDYFTSKDELEIGENLEGMVRRISHIRRYLSLLRMSLEQIIDINDIRGKYYWRLTENIISFSMELASLGYDVYKSVKLGKSAKEEYRLAAEAAAMNETRKIIQGISQTNKKSMTVLMKKIETESAELQKMNDRIYDVIKLMKKNEEWSDLPKEVQERLINLNLRQHDVVKATEEQLKDKAELLLRGNLETKLDVEILSNSALTAQEANEKIVAWSKQHTRALLHERYDQDLFKEGQVIFDAAGKALKEFSQSVNERIAKSGADELLILAKKESEVVLESIEHWTRKEFSKDALMDIALDLSKNLGGQMTVNAAAGQFDTPETRIDEQLRETAAIRGNKSYARNTQVSLIDLRPLEFHTGIASDTLQLDFDPQALDTVKLITDLFGKVFTAVGFFGSLLLDLLSVAGVKFRELAHWISKYVEPTDWLAPKMRDRGLKQAKKMGLPDSYLNFMEQQTDTLNRTFESVENADPSVIPPVERSSLAEKKEKVLTSQAGIASQMIQDNQTEAREWVIQSCLVPLDKTLITKYMELGDDRKLDSLLEYPEKLIEGKNNYKRAINLSDKDYFTWGRVMSHPEYWTWTTVDDILGFFDLVISNLIKIVLAVASYSGYTTFYGGISLLTVSSAVDFMVNFFRVAVVAGLALPAVTGLQVDFAAFIGLSNAAFFENEIPLHDEE